jgi:hypothetical protein
MQRGAARQRPPTPKHATDPITRMCPQHKSSATAAAVVVVARAAAMERWRTFEVELVALGLQALQVLRLVLQHDLQLVDLALVVGLKTASCAARR